MDILGFIRSQLHWLKGSGDNIPGGASSKKLTGFLMFGLTALLAIVWAVWAYLHNDWSLLIPILGILTTTGLVAFGINSSEKKKHLYDNEPPPKKEEKE